MKQSDPVLGMIQQGVLVLWVSLAPFLIGYLTIRQRRNREEMEKLINANTKISTEAFKVANGHNEKIADLTRMVVEKPVKVELVNDLSQLGQVEESPTLTQGP